MLRLSDANGNFTTILSQYYDYNIKEGINTLPILSFKYPLDDEWTNHFQVEGYISTEDNQYTIKEVRHNYNEVEVVALLNNTQFKCNHFSTLSFGTHTVSVKKSKKTVKKTVDNKDTLATAMGLILADIPDGWSFTDHRSDKEKAKKRVFKINKCNAWTAFKKLVDIYKFEWQIDRPNKMVHIYKYVGADNDAYFFEGLNVNEMEVDRNSEGCFTKIIPYGKNVNTTVNGNKKTVAVNIKGATDVMGEKVTSGAIIDKTYINKTITKHWTNTELDTPQDLYDEAYEELQAHCKPTISITAKIIDLSKQSDEYGALDFSIGDTIQITSKTVGVMGKFRVVEYTHYPDEPEKNEISLINRRTNLVNFVTNLQGAANTVGEISGSNTTVAGEIIESGSVGGQVIGEGEIDALNVDVLTANEIDTDSLIADKAFIETLTADNAFITNLTANNAFVDDLTANNAFVNYLDTKTIKADNITTGTIGANVIYAGKVNADGITTGTLDASKANVINLNADNIKAGTMDASLVNITNLTADKIAAGTLGANVVFGGKINGDSITSGTIDASKVHMVNLDASTITTGVLTADKILLRGTDKSLVYDLNNISGATQTISNDKLNGEILNDKTITAKQIDVGNLTADTGFINNLSANTALINQIQANVLDVNKLNALGIKAGSVDAEKISGKTIDGKTITGATITGAVINNGNGTFSVDANGYMTASNANISGSINAYSGNIGSFTIQNNTHDGYIGYGLQCNSFYNGEYHDVLVNDNQIYIRNITSGHQSVMTYDYVMSPSISSTDEFISAGTATFLGTTIDNYGDINFKSSATVIRNKAGNQALNPLTSSGNVALSTNASGNGDTNIYAGGKIMLQTTCKTSSGATVTSDRNIKKNILPIDDKYVKLFDELKPVSFEYKNGASGRTHLGYIAQDVKSAMDDVGLSDIDFAGWCKDKNDNELEENRATNDDGTYPEYTYALRYEELGILAVAKIKQQDKAIKQLEAEIKELKGDN